MTSIEEALKAHYLFCFSHDGAGNEADSAFFDAELLLCHVLDCDRTYLKTWPEKILTDHQKKQFTSLIEARRSGQPVAHILGRRDFWTLELFVTPATLIPRPDTEILIECALKLELPNKAVVLDLGTGTGAIALSLASERPEWQVTGSDAFAEVVELAQKNAVHNQLERVKVVCSAWFELFAGERFHLIVSNPPYIDPQDPHLKQGDLRFEPISALVAQEKGMADIHHIVKNAINYLHPKGWLILEHGYQQGELVRNCFEYAGFNHVKTVSDYGNNERITMGQIT